MTLNLMCEGVSHCNSCEQVQREGREGGKKRFLRPSPRLRASPPRHVRVEAREKRGGGGSVRDSFAHCSVHKCHCHRDSIRTQKDGLHITPKTAAASSHVLLFPNPRAPCVEPARARHKGTDSVARESD